MSTRLRTGVIRAFRVLGIRQFVATSSLGHRFLCHVGDSLGEMPYYNREMFAGELALCAAWLQSGSPGAVVLDVGAHVGFWSTHLVQMAPEVVETIYSFEAVPETFCKLVRSVERLSLGTTVRPICAAVVDRARAVRLSFSTWDSMCAQVSDGTLNTRAGDRVVYTAGLTLDDFAEAAAVRPALIKVDVEGGELDVFRGAERLLGESDRPALFFEFNPLTLRERGARVEVLEAILTGYTFHYVDDFEGKKLEFGTPVTALGAIDFVCNIFALPRTNASEARWPATLSLARQRLRE